MAPAPGETTIPDWVPHWLPTVLVGLVLVGAAVVMMRAHWRSWQRQQVDPGLNDWERQRLRVRFRRRMQTSGMIGVLGVAVPLGDILFMSDEKFPIVGPVYWVVVLMLGFWLLLLGLGDLAWVRVDSRMARDELRQIGKKRAELEGELARLQRHRSNGNQGSTGLTSEPEKET